MKTYTRSLIPHAHHMRHEMTEPERQMWYGCLRHLPHRFRRQRPFGPYVVDFYCPALRLVVEIDGDSHATAEAEAYDAQRTECLRDLGLHVLRFSNEEVMRNLEGIYALLLIWQPCSVEQDPPVSPLLA